MTRLQKLCEKKKMKTIEGKQQQSMTNYGNFPSLKAKKAIKAMVQAI